MVNTIASLRSPFLDVFFYFSTHLGSIYFIAISFLILTYFLIKKEDEKSGRGSFFNL